MARITSGFDGFVAETADGLLRSAYLITGDRGEAEDLVQECFLTLARHWRRVEKMEHPVAYARRVLINLAVRASKGQRRRQAELSSDTDEIAADWAGLDLVASREELRAALDQLTPRQRAVLVLRYFHDLSEVETANALGCTVGTVKSTSSRSLSHLRQLIEPATLHTRSEQT